MPGRSIQRSVPIADNTQHKHIFRTCLKIPDRTGSPRLVWNTENVRHFYNTHRVFSNRIDTEYIRRYTVPLWYSYSCSCRMYSRTHHPRHSNRNHASHTNIADGPSNTLYNPRYRWTYNNRYRPCTYNSYHHPSCFDRSFFPFGMIYWLINIGSSSCVVKWGSRVELSWVRCYYRCY